MDLTQLETDPVEAVDPNALLETLRRAAKSTLDALDDLDLCDEVTVNEGAMAEAFLQLDDWMARGGFPPGAWQGAAE